MVQLRWGFLPARPKGAPIINFRSEGRRFPKGRLPHSGVALFRVHWQQGKHPGKAAWRRLRG
jgi:hypothetical protein